MPKRIWKAVETEAREVGIVEATSKRSQRGSREKIRRARNKETKEEENGRDKKGGGRIGNLG